MLWKRTFYLSTACTKQNETQGMGYHGRVSKLLLPLKTLQYAHNASTHMAGSCQRLTDRLLATFSARLQQTPEPSEAMPSKAAESFPSRWCEEDVWTLIGVRRAIVSEPKPEDLPPDAGDECQVGISTDSISHRSSPARALPRRRKKSMTFLAAPELPE